jgi:hypothetical protein
MWKFHRGATRPFFNRDRISDFEIFSRHADRAIERMKERMHAGYPVDFQVRVNGNVYLISHF